MPAAAVIPAQIVYTKVVAVKKLVVGFRGPPVSDVVPRLSGACGSAFGAALGRCGPPRGEHCPAAPSFSESPSALDCSGRGIRDVYFEQIRVFQAGRSL